MKKILSVFFAVIMLLSIAFTGEATAYNGSFSVQEQTQTRTGNVTVRRKRRGGVVGGTRYVAHKTKRGAIYVGKKTYQGGKYVGKKTVQGTRYTSHKVKRGTKATISRTKKILLGN